MSAERAALYRRQSSDPRNDELGIERQLQVCQRVADARGFDVTRVITDNAVSASKKGRAGYAELIDLMKSGQVDVVLILRIDRLLRLNDELEELITLVERYPVRVVTAEGDIDLSTPQGRLLARILVSVAQNEMEVKSARHKLANAQKAAQGLPYASWRPFGYEDDRVTIRESEAAVLREMASRMMNGHSYRELAQWLNREGITTSRGGQWAPRSVRQMLEAKRSAGIREYQGVDYPAVWPAIFDAETWERLQFAIRHRTQVTPMSAPIARKYLLTGLVYCGKCDSPMNGSMKRDRADKERRRAYMCRAPGDRVRGGCGGVQRGAPALEHFVTEAVLTRLDTPRLTELIADVQDDGELRELLAARERLQQRLNEIRDDYALGDLDKADMQRMKATAGAELARLDERLVRKGSGPRVSLPPGQTVRAAWEISESDGWRRGILSLVIKRIVVLPTDSKPVYRVGDRWYRFDPSYVSVDWKA